MREIAGTDNHTGGPMVGRSLFANDQFTFSETSEGLLTIEVAGSISYRARLISDLAHALRGDAPRTHCLFGLRNHYPDLAVPLLALANQIDWRPVTEVTFNEVALSARLPSRDEQ